MTGPSENYDEEMKQKIIGLEQSIEILEDKIKKVCAELDFFKTFMIDDWR